MEEKTDTIMRAVRGVLAEKGCQGATISEIAMAAGISRGLLHYYFKSKEDMLCRVISHSMEHIALITGGIFEKAPNSREAAAGLCAALRNTLASDPHFFMLFLEAWVLARKGPAANDLLKDIHSRFRGVISQGIESLARKAGRPAPKNGACLATILAGIVDGIGMQVTIEPSLLADESLWESLRLSIFALLESFPAGA